jgi:UrcA family protein
MARFEIGQPDFETGQPAAGRSANSHAVPRQSVAGQASKELFMIRFQPLLALALLTAPALAAAAPARPQHMPVAVGDLDLASDKGQRILAMRIQRAARALCAPNGLASQPATIRNARRCVVQARSNAAASAETLAAAAAEDREEGRGG